MYLNKWVFLFLSLMICFQSCKEKQVDQKEEVIQKEEIDQNNRIDYNKLGIAEKSVSSLKALKEGSLAPDFDLYDQNNKQFKLSEAVKNGPVVLVFFRGYWCPICSRHMEAFSEGLDDVKAKGAQVVFVSPQIESYRDTTVENSKLDVIFLSDSKDQLMSNYGVAFNVTDTYKGKFKNWVGVDLAEVNNQEEPLLPVPATYIIGKDMKIKWVHFDPTYKNRSEIKDILEHL